MQTTTRFTITAIGNDELGLTRAAGTDVSGNAAVAVRSEGGEPLRCCLRSAAPDEDLIEVR